MATLAPDEFITVAGKNQDKQPKPTSPRDRIDLRAEPEWIARVTAAAERFGLSVSAYIRLAVTERLERDEATGKGKGKGQ